MNSKELSDQVALVNVEAGLRRTYQSMYHAPFNVDGFSPPLKTLQYIKATIITADPILFLFITMLYVFNSYVSRFAASYCFMKLVITIFK